jgi:hypothetical protein
MARSKRWEEFYEPRIGMTPEILDAVIKRSGYPDVVIESADRTIDGIPSAESEEAQELFRVMREMAAKNGHNGNGSVPEGNGL